MKILIIIASLFFFGITMHTQPSNNYKKCMHTQSQKNNGTRVKNKKQCARKSGSYNYVSTRTVRLQYDQPDYRYYYPYYPLNWASPYVEYDPYYPNYGADLCVGGLGFGFWH